MIKFHSTLFSSFAPITVVSLNDQAVTMPSNHPQTIIKYFYTNPSGEKTGPLTYRAIQALVTAGIIQRNTPLETEDGRRGLAGQVPGLFDSVSPPAPTPPPPGPSAVQFFYIDASGRRQGPINEQQLKVLATQNIILPNTPLETDAGYRVIAGQIPGLFPKQQVPSKKWLIPLAAGAGVFALIVGLVFLAGIDRSKEDTGPGKPKHDVPILGNLLSEKAPAFVELKGHADVVTSIAFLPGGAKIVTSDGNDTRIWDAHSGEELRKLEGKYGGFSPDGTIIATVDDNKGPDGEMIKTRDNNKVNVRFEDIISVEFSTKTESEKAPNPPRGSIAAAIKAREERDRVLLSSEITKITRIWDVGSGKELKKFGNVFRDFSPDSKKIVTKGGQIWDIDSGKRLQILKSTYYCFSMDGRKIVTWKTILDADSGKELHKFEGEYKDFSPDRKRIVASDRDNSTSTIWDVDSGRRLQMLEGSYGGFSSDGTKIATMSHPPNLDRDLTVTRIWDAGSGRKLHTLDGGFAAFSQNGKKIVTARMTLGNTTQTTFALFYGGIPNLGDPILWDADSGEMLQSFLGPSWESRGYRALAISPDGKSVVLANSADETVRIWNASANSKWAVDSGKELQKLEEYKAPSGAIAVYDDGHSTIMPPAAQFSPDGKKIAILSGYNTVRIWTAP